MTLYPLKLDRHLSPRLWGGNRLEPFLALETCLDTPTPPTEPLGESWQVYADNKVLNGPLAGQTLAEVAHTHGAALLGTLPLARYGASVPLLAKFIDAADRLSIQVHPDDAYAHTVEAATGYHGKTEAWYVIDAEPGATVIWGFKDTLSKDEVREKIGQGALEPHLNLVPVAAGDVIYNPAGTVHAIGAGIFLFEIQQSSDLTYRLYDYGRRDSRGSLRELHIDKALEVADLSPGEHAKVAPRELARGKTELIRVEHFAMERWQVSGEQQERTHTESMEILTSLEGDVTLTSDAGETPLAQAESVVLPASLGAYRLTGQATVLRCYVPSSV